MYPHEMLANFPHNSAGIANMPRPTLFYGDVLCISFSDGRCAKASKTSLSAQDPQMAFYDAACLSRINSEHRQIRLRGIEHRRFKHAGSSAKCRGKVRVLHLFGL